MTAIHFYKMVASGNDFIVIDNRLRKVKNGQLFAKKICRPHFGIGADGVLLLEASKKADFRARIFNSDGSEAETCGNGFRCIALFAHEALHFPKQMQFESVAGLIRAVVLKRHRQKKWSDTRVCVKLVNPKDHRERVRLSGIKSEWTRLIEDDCAFINTGVPHAVFFTKRLEQFPVEAMGREVRYHRAFKPRGANVNFVKITGPSSIDIRTYERGVEAETLACGSGSSASAIFSVLTHRVKQPVRVRTRSGEILIIKFDLFEGNVQNVFLEGNTKFVFKGEIIWS